MNPAEIASRIRSNLALKIVLGLVLTGVWPTYLYIQRHPLFPVTAMSATWLDRTIPFSPGAVYLYESLWLFMPIAPWLMMSRAELARYTEGFALVCLVSFSFFVIHPTACPRPVGVHDANALYEALIRTDNELNAFPSLHAALAVFHGACCHALFGRGERHGRTQLFIWIWAAGIVAATLLTKQHVIVDVVAGMILGFGGYVVFCRPSPMAVMAIRRDGGVR